MATVSILIPAYRPQYLRRAIVSAQLQTYRDIEILVGDDTSNGDLRSIVESIDDPRVHYFHHGFQNSTRNSLALWERAQGAYVKWLFDDDVLMPESVEVLGNALVSNPAAPMAFHGRVVIDENDNVTSTPAPLLDAGATALVERSFLIENMVGRLVNFVGEPSNIMLRRSLADASTMFDYASFKLDFLADVALYLNVSKTGPIVAVGGYYSAFRQHSAQSSNAASPNFSAGLYEWELFVRGEAAEGELAGEALPAARDALAQLYACGAALPEIQRLVANLDEFDRVPAAQLLASGRFQADLAHARSTVASRVAARNAAKTGTLLSAFQPVTPKPQCICAVCERPVARWLPHEARGNDFDFFAQVPMVGSTLENHYCPNCYCNDRDRHLWLYLAYSGVLEAIESKRILHIAPEARLEPRIRALGPLDYICGDLFPKQPHHRKVNVEALDFADNTFDLIICNHVLEHVDNPAAALAEFQRCLTPGGHLVAQTPYSPALKNTFEMNVPVSPAFRTKYFGQDDHVRLFGADIVKLFRDAGLAGDLFASADVLVDVDSEVWGYNEHEPFFLFSKEASFATAG